MTCIETRGLRKAFGTTVAVDGVDLRVEEGRIVGLIVPMAQARPQRSTRFSGSRPIRENSRCSDAIPGPSAICLCAMSASSPMLPAATVDQVSQALDYVAGVHPRFDGERLKVFLPRPPSGTPTRSENCRKHGGPAASRSGNGIDAKLLVLDEPTLGLDILFRKQFYDSLLNDYFDRTRTIVVHPSGGRNTGRPHRCDVHQPWPDRAQLQHGRIRVALCGSDGESRASRCRAGAQANARAPGIRAQHPAV